MAQQYDPVTWRNVAMPDNQTSLIKMAADRSNLLNDVINSFQSRDKQILDRNVSNLNATEAYNTKEQSAKIIQALSSVANPTADGAKLLADTVGRLDPNMPVNKAELFNTGFNAIGKLTENVKNKLGIQQSEDVLSRSKGEIEAATKSLIAKGKLPEYAVSDPSHVALLNQVMKQEEQNTRETTANAAAANVRVNERQVGILEKEANAKIAGMDVDRQGEQLKLDELKKTIEQNKLFGEVNNAFNVGESINPETVKKYKENGGDFSKLMQLGTNKYFQFNPEQNAVVNESTAVNKIVEDLGAKSGAASAEEMEYFSDTKNATYQNMVFDIKQTLLNSGYSKDRLDSAVEQVIHLTRGVVDHKNATEYNHNLFRPSGNEATDPETVVLGAAKYATGLLISRDKLGKQAKEANEKARNYSLGKLSGKNE